MTLEDFTTFTKVDEEGTLTVTATKVTGTADRNVDTYTYKDFTAAHFDTIKHTFATKITIKKHAGFVGAWGINNAVNDMRNAGNGLYVAHNYVQTTDIENFYLREYVGSTENNDYDIITPAQFYCKVERSGTTATCKYYSDAAMTVLLGTLSLTIANNKYRYLYAFTSYDSNNNGYDMGIDIENLDINEAVPLPGLSGGTIRKIGAPTPMNVGIGF